MSATGKLVCLDGPQQGRSVNLNKRKMRVGRAPDCEIVLDDKYASRTHAFIALGDGAFTVEDAGSKNGVLLDNERLPAGAAAILSDGMVVTFAQTRFRFEDPSATLTNLELESVTQFPRLVVHPATRQVMVDGELLQPPLSVRQFELLSFLQSKTGEAVSKDDIAAAVWPEDQQAVPDGNIDRLVSRVRSRLAEASGGEQYIETVRGFGYRLGDSRAET